MNFHCPHCTQNLEIFAEWSGHAVECPSCQQALTIPAAYRYCRLNITANNGAKGLHVSEFGLFTDQR